MPDILLVLLGVFTGHVMVFLEIYAIGWMLDRKRKNGGDNA